MKRTRRCVTAALAFALFVNLGAANADKHGKHWTIPAAYMELIEASQKEKFGITFYMHGQSVPGIVTKIIDERTIEARNQQFDRIIIRLDRVSAIAR